MKKRRVGRFPDTRWSVIALLDGDETEAAEALEILCELYWQPIHAFCEHVGLGTDAEDATQAFFERLLRKGGFSSADRERGRLRNLLLTDLRYFLRDDWAKRSAKKRGGGEAPIPIDSIGSGIDAVASVHTDEQEDAVFDREWGVNLVQTAMDRLGVEYAAREKSELFEAMKPLISETGDDALYHQVRSRLGLNKSQMAGALFRLRKRLRELLERCVADTVRSAEDVQEELFYLREVLSHG